MHFSSLCKIALHLDLLVFITESRRLFASNDFVLWIGALTLPVICAVQMKQRRSTVRHCIVTL